MKMVGLISYEICVETDVIPDFWKLRVAKKTMFSDRTVSGVHTKLIKTEQNKHEKKTNLVTRVNKIELGWPVNKKLLGSVAFKIRLSVMKISQEHIVQLDAKLQKIYARS